MKTETEPQVCVTIVTFNSARYIRRCLETVLQQDIPLDVVVVDNASTDSTRSILRDFRRRIRTIQNPVNVGFAAAQNTAIAASRAPWVLTLNPDVLLQSGFVRALLEAAAIDPQVGTVCGKLLSIGAGFEPLPEPRLDSTGIYFSPSMRHFDRGWHEPDRSSQIPEYVFGASAAAALYRRSMIADVSVDGHFFDPDFFAYREDADVSWRAMLQGWRCIYTPEARAWHVRSVTPGSRRRVPSAINMHSVKNRFLMRVKNLTGGVFRRHWWPMLARDLVVLGGTLFTEPTSLPALWHVVRCLPRALRQRSVIMRRRKLSDEALAQWFSFKPVSQAVVPGAVSQETAPALALARTR